MMRKSVVDKKWLILLTCVLFTFMATLDANIVNVALPVMAKELSVSSSQIQLIVISYLLTVTALILIYGRLGDMIGKEKIFKWGTFMFTVGSFLCGIAPTFTMLVIFRIIQAIGASATMAVNQGLIVEAFGNNERGKALGILSTVIALGALIGPPLGGFLVDTISWNSIFLINIPVGMVALWIAFKTMPKKEIQNTKQKLDYFGSLLFMIFVILFFVSFHQTKDVGFSDLSVIIELVLSLVAFVWFIYWEYKNKAPLLHLELFKNITFSVQIVAQFIMYASIFSVNIILPFYLQYTKSFTASITGLIFMVSPIILGTISPISGTLSDRIGPKSLTGLGLFVMSIALVLMSNFEVASSITFILFSVGLFAFGMALFQAPNISLIMSTVDKTQLGIAGSVNALVRNMAMVSGVTFSTIFLYTQMSSKAGYVVTDYIENRSDLFIYGMHSVFITAAGVAFIGAMFTLLKVKSKIL